jgi:peptidylprolyl isomerase
MKFLGLVVSICIALTVVACGDDDWAEVGKSEAANTDRGKSQVADADSEESKAANAKPSIQPPSGSPPKELVVEDVVEGWGPKAGPGDELKVRFVAVDQAGKEVYNGWRKNPFRFELGTGNFGTGWDKGLTGMKVGGRRELSIPADEAFEEKEALYYVVEVLAIRPVISKDGAGQAGGASPAR